MTRVLHIFSAASDPAAWDFVEILQKRLGELLHPVCHIDPPAARKLAQSRGINAHIALRRPWPMPAISRSLKSVSRGLHPAILHAWDLPSALAAATELPNFPLVLTILDPAICRDAARWIRGFPSTLIVSAANQVVRRRLLEAGMALENTVVIRGPVDFSAINAARSEGMRAKLTQSGGPILLSHGPASTEGGQFQGVWAAAIVRQIHHNLKIIAPYSSRETARLLRFVRSIGFEDMLIHADERWSWAQLAACSDVMLAPAIGDVSTEPLAAAMAAGTIIVGTATRAITELIADRSNGLLIRDADPAGLAARLLTAIEDTDLRRRVTETARAQAYEVFGVRAYLDHCQRLYDNVLHHRPAAEGISDTAMAA